MIRRRRWLVLLAAAAVVAALAVVVLSPRLRGGFRFVRAALAAPSPGMPVDDARLADGRAAAAAAVAESAENGGFAVVIEKSTYTLVVFRAGAEVQRWPVELGADPVGRKEREGDMRTPEGLYRITWRRDRGETDFYRAFLLDYPNAADRAEGRTGSLIEIHGSGSGRRPSEGGRNWTWGCVALANDHIDALFEAAEGGHRITAGTPVAIAWSIGEDTDG